MLNRPFRITPNGFRSFQTGDARNAGTIDPHFEMLWAKFRNHEGYWNWADRRPYIDYAMKMFPNPEEFLKVQLANRNLCAYRRLFIEETARFIAYGQRQFSIFTTSSLFKNEDSSGPFDTMAKAGSDVDAAIWASCARQDAIARWLAQPNGFDDMVCTMAVLFGPRGVVTA